jgi:predicted ATPase
MIHSLQIHGYRGFTRFEMSGLGRVNLIVGTNNSGKSSVLEALYLLVSGGDPGALFQLLWRRGERSLEERNPRHAEFELDVSHLFHGHEFRIGSKLSLSAKNQTPAKSLTLEVAEATKEEQAGLFRDTPAPARLVLRVTGHPKPTVSVIPIGPRGGISSDLMESPRRFRRGTTDVSAAQYVTTESLSGDALVALWDKIALSPDEPLVLRALKFLDPDVERIAAQASHRIYGYTPGTRGGFIIKRKGHDLPIPIGSMGDGMWRMLAMAIAITQCKGGVLLVDEIDTGLHYSVMTDMWRLIFGAAKEFDVQVFATSHSEDCVHSLAKICEQEADANHRVTLQRIEAAKQKSVPYSEGEIAAAAARGIEVR